MNKTEMADAVREGMRQADRQRSRGALIALGVVAVIVFGLVGIVSMFWP
jgi:hypothetical protein